MGAGAGTLDAMEASESLTLDEARKLAGERFDQAAFDEAAATDGKVTLAAATAWAASVGADMGQEGPTSTVAPLELGTKIVVDGRPGMFLSHNDDGTCVVEFDSDGDQECVARSKVEVRGDESIMPAQETPSCPSMVRIPFTDELLPHVTLAVVTRVLKVALRIAIQGIPEAPAGHEHHGFSIAVGDGDELMKEEDGQDGPEPVYFAPYDFNPFERGHLDVDENSVIRGAFNGDGLCVVDGRTAKCRAATMIVLSMRGGGSTGGGRHKSSRALSRKPGGGCVLAFVILTMKTRRHFLRPCRASLPVV